MTPRHARILAVVISATVLVVAAVLLLRPDGRSDPAASTATPTASSAATPTPDAPPVIVPGRPGEPATTRAASDVRDASPPPYNSLDVWFVRMMIPHHAQALQMAELAPTRTDTPQILAVADRIRVAQAPEIGVMRAWLQARHLPQDVSGHDHGTMRGMQSPEEIQRLTAARGADFDRLFVQMMTEHHQGAVIMATDLLKVGSDPSLSELATNIAHEQAVEINRMRELSPA
ncbi:MAG TPA: DUF305 domain-containing protein [Jiangellales bacterium]|nr:DUF305 domain-containing protein [Jiangellales bacterium]